MITKTNNIVVAALLLLLTLPIAAKKQKQQLWPDGTPMDAWFSDTAKVSVERLGRQYVITDFGVKNDSTMIQTEAIQQVIDRAAADGGGCIVVPEGTFLSGSLFFKSGTRLYIKRGGKLKGIDAIKHYELLTTRMEGQTLTYFAALVNADSNDGFTIAGEGTIDGNGLRYWEEFWIRRQYNRNCTNLEAMRPRLVYISNCRNVTVQDVRLQNSPFWTNHLYKCDHVRYLGCYIYASTEGVKAPSSDAIDLDVCHDVIIRGCYMNVNDDAVVLKGGKGTWADKDPNNGPNARILVEECHFGTVHAMMTLGSESLHDRNVIMRRCTSDNANRVLWLKMRPDTPQHYEYVTVEDIRGRCGSFLVVRPWTQFFKPEQRDDMPLSQCNAIKMQRIKMDCRNFFDVGTSDKYRLTDFTFTDIDVNDEKQAFDPAMINDCHVKNVKINGKAL